MDSLVRAHRGSSEFESIVDDGQESDRMRAFAMQHYGLLAADEPSSLTMRDFMRGHLREPTPVPVRREALLALVRARDDATCAGISAMLGDPAFDEEQDLVIRCCVDLRETAALPTIRSLAIAGRTEATRLAAINALGAWHDPEAGALLAEAMRAGSPRIRRAAQRAANEIATASSDRR